ncbi:MAG: hypothetical protein AABZ55_10925 [Bdellovibrionota bacterium]
MKSGKLAIVLAIGSTLVANAAFAHFAITTTGNGSNRAVLSDTGSPLHSSSVMDMGTSIIYKQLIIAAEKPAMDVLNGGAVTDLFVEAREAVEARVGAKFESDRAAAGAIVLEANSN